MLADVQGMGTHGSESFPMRIILARDAVKSTDRAHRIDQAEKVTVYKLIVKKT